MVVVSSDLKWYKSDINGDIDLGSQLTTGIELFPDVLDIANDVEKKIWIKNTNGSSALNLTRLYAVNGHTITNTNNTPIVTNLAEIYVNIPAGTYSLSFPTVNSVIVTPPSGLPRLAQTITCDNTTLNAVYLADNLPILLAFNSGLTTGDTATIKISDGCSYLWMADDNAGVPDTYAQKNSYDAGVDVGTLAASGTHAIWIKQSIPDGTSNTDNPRKFVPICRGAAA